MSSANANPELLAPCRHDIYPFIDPSSQLHGAATQKTILITGAGTGIGRAIAEAFARAGASTIILAARRQELLQETKAIIDSQAIPNCRILVRGDTDIADAKSVDRLFASLDVVPDVLVHNAAVSNLTNKLIDAPVDTWCREIDVNIKGTFLVCRAFLRILRENPERRSLNPRIINLSSNVFWHDVPGRSSYAASKIAVNSITEYIDNECLQDKALADVRCVAMHPGGVAGTELSSSVGPDILKLLIDKPALAAGTAVYLSTLRATPLMGRFVNATWDMEQLEAALKTNIKDQWLKTRVLGVRV